jgi:hypothetical protein
VWINPRYRDRNEQPPTEPPAEQGQLLATFPRRNGQLEQELRANLAECNGHEYIALRLWQRDPDSGVWWPLKGRG